MSIIKRRGLLHTPAPPRHTSSRDERSHGTVRKDSADCGIVTTLTIVLHANVSTRVVR